MEIIITIAIPVLGLVGVAVFATRSMKRPVDRVHLPDVTDVPVPPSRESAERLGQDGPAIIPTLKAYARGELTRSEAATALADSGGLTPRSIGDMLEDPIGALLGYERVFARTKAAIFALEGQARTPEQRRAVKELIARADSLPSVWDERI